MARSGVGSSWEEGVLVSLDCTLPHTFEALGGTVLVLLFL